MIFHLMVALSSRTYASCRPLNTICGAVNSAEACSGIELGAAAGYVSGEAMIIVKAVFFFFFLTMMEHVGTIETYIKTILILKKGLHLLVRVPLTWKGQPI